MRLSRPCYDKLHRCPGHAGGGMRYPKGESRCFRGRIQTLTADKQRVLPFVEWRFLRCDTCDVITWPSMVRWLDWRWWKCWRPRQIHDWLWFRSRLYRRVTGRWFW